MSALTFKTFPKAAQRRITDLEAEVERWRKLAMLETQAASNVMLRDYTEREPRGLPKDSIVSFAIGDDWLDVSHREGKISVYWRGASGRLAVYPESSNVLALAIIPHRIAFR